MSFKFTLNNSDGWARAWVFSTPHGDIQTPVFMPVGTKATVKWISKQDLDEMGAQIILNNTYHLYLRPWDETVAHFWWAHEFQKYDKPILTDSGWFQVFSLGQWLKDGKPLVKITEEWVHFKSHIDGSQHYFDAERVMDIQSNIWADIIMAFDECAPGDSSHIYARAAMERTHRWAIRSLEQVKKNNIQRAEKWQHPQALFPIIQWVIYDDLREESAKFISELDTPWIAIWGLSVWESIEDMYRILDVLQPHLPENKPHYLMGVGRPENLIEAIARGIDMFDCVLPTRLGRHGRAFGTHGDINIKNLKYKLDTSPLDSECPCKVCKTHTKWYLRHLITENEMHGMELLSYHNLAFLIHLTDRSREAILENRFEGFRKEFWNKLNDKK